MKISNQRQRKVGLSIIIPTCHRPRDLARCLELVTAQVRSCADEVEIIVSDDSKNDASQVACRQYQTVRYTCGPRRGPAANRNHGARLARGEWLVFLDDDCLPRGGWLAALHQAMSQTTCSVLEGKVVSEPILRDDELAPVNLTGGMLWSCNLVVRRELFWRMGGFDECLRFAHLEDVDLRLRLEKARMTWQFVPDAVVYHPPKKHKPWYQIPWHMEADFYLARKHGLPFARSSANPVVLLRHFLRQALGAEALQGCLAGVARGLFYAVIVTCLAPIWYVKAWRQLRRSARASCVGRAFATGGKNCNGGRSH